MVYKKRLREITKRENLLRAARGRKLWRIVIAHYCYVLYFTNMMFRFVSLMLYFCFVWPNNDIKYPIKSFKTKKLSVYLCFIRWYILVLQTVCNILVASLFSKILRRVRLFQSFFFVFFKKILIPLVYTFWAGEHRAMPTESNHTHCPLHTIRKLKITHRQHFSMNC